MFTPFNRQKVCRHGTMIYNIHDLFIGRSLDLYGEWTEGEIELFQQIIYPGNYVVEVGANIGSHTVFLARAVWPSGHVWAFEPQRLVYQLLCANLAINSVPNVDARNVVLGNAPGELLVPVLDYNQANNFGGLELGSYTQGEPVAVITLDSLNLPRCDLLKVDVEGMELQVIQGAADTIKRCQPLLYVENDRKDRSRDLVRTIDALGYNMFWHMPLLYQPNNFAGNPDNVFGTMGSFNMFCVPKTNRNYNLEPFQPVPVPA